MQLTWSLILVSLEQVTSYGEAERSSNRFILFLATSAPTLSCPFSFIICNLAAGNKTDDFAMIFTIAVLSQKLEREMEIVVELGGKNYCRYIQ